jgi:hypothetical protein
VVELETIVCIVIVVAYGIAYIMEAKHDDFQRQQLSTSVSFVKQIYGKTVDKSSYILFESLMYKFADQWHRWDFIKQAFLATFWGIALSFLLNDLIYLTIIPLIGFERMLVFNIALNYVSGNKNRLHLGKGYFDKLLIKLFGSWWPLAIATLMGICISLIIWLDFPF